LGLGKFGTPRRVVVASKKICWWYSKKDFVVEPRRVGRGSVLHAISPISEAKLGWWVVSVYKNVSTKQMCVSPPAIYSRAIYLPTSCVGGI
jgi:hypothetical protein